MVSHFDSFFRAHYRGLVGYCSKFGFREQDVEEMVADVILRHYDEYRAAIDGPNPDTTMRHWMARRVLLNLRSVYLKIEQSRVEALPERYDAAHVDHPEAILDLKQRMPVVPQVLVQYEQYGGEGGPRGANNGTLRCQFHREKRKFMKALGGDA